MTDVFIGNYRVIKKIGAGGQARVYLAVHKDVPNLRVILKILSDATLADRFKQEADKLALLDGHPSICRIKHFFNEGDDLVIAMEYIHGETLDQLIADARRLPAREILTIVKKLLAVLEFAHQREIFHRDIKPSNIMITREGDVKVIDFGIAKSKGDPNLTQAGSACGTPAYMAPEQFTPTEETDYARIDIYAVGVTMYFALTGTLPFKADNEFLMRDKKLASDPPTVSSINPGVSPELERLVMKALKRDPEERYATTAEMREAVETILHLNQPAAQDTPTASISVTPHTPPAIDTPATKPKSKSMLMGIIGVVLAGILAVVGFMMFGGEGGPDLTAPTPHAPPNGSTISDTRQPTVSWRRASTDANVVLEYADNDQFTDLRTRANIRDTMFTFRVELENGTYYWRLWTLSPEGRVGPSETRSFTVDVPVGTEPQSTATGQLVLDISPSADRVTIDDTLVYEDQSDIETELPTGRHIVTVANADSRQKLFIDTVSVNDGQTTNRNYRFSFPPPPDNTPVMGEIRVGSTPRGAQIYINDELQRQKTNFAFRLQPGSHTIKATIEFDGELKELSRTVNLKADQVQRLSFDFEAEKAYLNP